MKNLISLFVVLTMLFSLTTPVFAVYDDGVNALENDGNSSFSFIDRDGKANTVKVTISQIGSAHVDYYIDSVLINSSNATILESSGIGVDFINDATNVRVEYVDYNHSSENESHSYIVPLSNYLKCSHVYAEFPDSVSAGYIYQGKINYKTYYDSSGRTYTNDVSIYLQVKKTNIEYKTINGKFGDAVSNIISVVAAVLSFYYSPFKAFAAELVYSAAVSLGVNIVNGILQGAIQKRYYVDITYYQVKACDESTSRDYYYDADSYRVALEGGGFSSDYYYEGYLPWDTDLVALWIFNDFWSYPFPGVEGYSK